MKLSSVFVPSALLTFSCLIGARAQEAGILERGPAPAQSLAFRARTPEKSAEALARKLEIVSRWLESADLPARGDGGGAGVDSTCVECGVGSILCEEKVSGELSAGDCQLGDNSFADVWSFRLDDAEEVNIALTSSAFDTFLFLTDGNCLIVRSNDDCSEGDADRSCISAQLPPGDYSVAVNSFSDAESGDYELRIDCGPQEGPLFERGDANADTSIDITDGIFVLNFLFLGGSRPPCLEAADTNDDDGLDLTDGVFVLNFLFLGGPEPPAPFPGCGSLDAEVDCDSFPPCE